MYLIKKIKIRYIAFIAAVFSLIMTIILIVMMTFEATTAAIISGCDNDTKSGTSTGTNTSSETSSYSASNMDPWTEGTDAYKNAKDMIDRLDELGIGGTAIAGLMGWVNTEGSFDIIGRAEGHYGGGLKDSIAHGAVPISSYPSEYQVAGGGIWQITPYTDYAPLNDSAWEDMDKMVQFMVDRINGTHPSTNGMKDWISSHDISGRNQSFTDWVKQTDLEAATLGWNAHERGRRENILAAAPNKLAEAKKFYEKFELGKIEYDEAAVKKNFPTWFGETATTSGDSSSGKSNTCTTTTGKATKKALEIALKIANGDDISYSMDASRRGVSSNGEVPKWMDCSYFVTYALSEAGVEGVKGGSTVSMLTQSNALNQTGKIFKEVPLDKAGEGAILVWGGLGGSGAGGHTAILMEDYKNGEGKVVECSAKYTGQDVVGDAVRAGEVTANESARGMGDPVALLLVNDTSTTSSCDDDFDCDDSSSSGNRAVDGTGQVPSDATAWGYKPEDVPDSLKEFIHDPTDAGLVYGGPTGWFAHSGQCVDLTESLAAKIWETGMTTSPGFGNGQDQSSNWANYWNTTVKETPIAGAVWSTTAAGEGNGYGHTGIVSHVFEDGSIMAIEQNTPLSGHDRYGVNDTWNYRIFSPEEQKSLEMTFAYPEKGEPNWENDKK